MAKCFGQGSGNLAWFWCIKPSEDALTRKWIEEYCRSSLQYPAIS